MVYRREIDGLRALAVIPVVLFHAGFKAFGGGFVGVDVFFVISGFLITSLVIGDRQAGRFSIVDFYERRARRILPALFLVMFACLPFSWLWLYPIDLRRFAQSLVAVATYSSNVLFLLTSGYFDTAADTKPLLHTWSLALEEQFYLLYPPLLMATWRIGRRRMVLLLLALGAGSLMVAHWGSANSPVMNFYLLPTRAWELLIGALVAFGLSSDAEPRLPAAAAQGAALAGLFLVVGSVFVFDKYTPFPSLYTLAPTVGTALIIMFGTQATLVGKFLGTKILVSIGLISYSAYLWHQPIFAFVKQRNMDDPGALLAMALCAVAFVLAYLSWRYVERPFRQRSRFSRRQLFVFAVCCTLFFIGMGFLGHFSNGFDYRISKDRAALYNALAAPEASDVAGQFREECNFYSTSNGYRTRRLASQIPTYCYVRNAGGDAVFLWGDSHAKQLYPGLKRTLPDTWQILQVTTNGCVPKLDANQDVGDYCEYSNWFAYDAIRRSRPTVVVIAQNAGHDADVMAAFARRLESLGVKRVVFTGPVPHWKGNLPEIIVKKLWGSLPRRSFVALDSDVIADSERLNAAFVASQVARLVSPVDYFCNRDGCLLYQGDALVSGLVSKDYGHLSLSASYMFARDVLSEAIVQR